LSAWTLFGGIQPVRKGVQKSECKNLLQLAPNHAHCAVTADKERCLKNNLKKWQSNN